MAGLYTFLGVEVDTIVKKRKELIKLVEKERIDIKKEYPESKFLIDSMCDWFVEELDDKFYCEDYE